MKKMDDDSLMTYGPYKGEQMRDVPAHYLMLEYYRGCINERVRDYITENIDRLMREDARFEYMTAEDFDNEFDYDNDNESDNYRD